MIVERLKYLNIKQVLAMLEKGETFMILLTSRKTMVLVETFTSSEGMKNGGGLDLHLVRQDKLPYSITEGKRITSGQVVFRSTVNTKEELLALTPQWNMGMQIMAYTSDCSFYPQYN